MSLLVHAYVRDADGEMHFIETDDPSQEMAGFESYRQRAGSGSAAAVSGWKA